MAVTLKRRRFTVDEYHRMGEAGILSEDDRVELIEGEIIEMTSIGSRHAGTVAHADHLFSSQLGQRAIVWVQNPIELSSEDSEPQPDVALLRPRPDFYRRSTPKRPTYYSSSRSWIRPSSGTAASNFRCTRGRESARSGSST